MAKKKKWFGWGEKEQDNLYSNTQKQHAEKIKKIYDQDGFEVDDTAIGAYAWEDYDNNYAFDFNRRFDGGGRVGNKQTFFSDEEIQFQLENGKKGKEVKSYQGGSFDSGWKEYESSGRWQGYEYYKPSTLSYKYVQQMANSIAGLHNIKIEVGNDWDVDLKTKTLTYNPTTLMSVTKGELLATLLHEVGKLKYSVHMDELNSPFITQYKNFAYEPFVIYEDLRIDDLMLQSYASASEVYESQSPIIFESIKKYQAFADNVRKVLIKHTEEIYNKAGFDSEGNFISDPAELEKRLMIVCGVKTIEETRKKSFELTKKINDKETLWDYCGLALSKLYAVDNKGLCEKGNSADRVYKTLMSAHITRKYKTSQETVLLMDKDVYPEIEDLMKEAQEGNEDMQKEFGKDMAKRMMGNALATAGNQNKDSQGMNSTTPMLDRVGNSQGNASPSMRSGAGGLEPGSGGIPKEWINGEYKPLKESVDYEIKSLIRKLTFLKRKEQVMRYETNQKRGKLNMKSLYRHRAGGRNLFKRKLENVDTIRSFAFSLLVDISGSMSGQKMVHTTRALIMFAEVFHKMEIPYEIVPFDSYAHDMKEFGDKLDEKLKVRLGGMTRMANGGTNLLSALQKSELMKQPETNKVCVVLTDGYVSDTGYLDRNYFRPMAAKNAKSLAIGIGTSEDEMKRLCMGNGRNIDNAVKLPDVFVDILKDLIFKKK